MGLWHLHSPLVQVHFGSLSQWHLHLGVGTSPKEIPVRLSVMMESRSEMVFMGRVGLFTLYIPDPTGQDFRRVPEVPRGKPCLPRGTERKSDWAELFCVVFPPGGREWVKVGQSGREW